MSSVCGPHLYWAITGRTIDLSKLTPTEREFLKSAARECRLQPRWSDFSAWWRPAFRQSGLKPKSFAFSICEDLESRLGISQGEMAPADYRGALANSISGRFESRNAFCTATGIDPAHLSRVLAGRAELSLGALQKIFEVLGLVLLVRPRAALKSELDRDVDVLESL
jgi:transcriptional regulator with XRE-family HTH domain